VAGRDYTRTTPGLDGPPKRIQLTSEVYAWEGRDYDCSIEDTIFIQLPTQPLAERLQLTWNGQEGELFAPGGQLTMFDPSVTSEGPSVLLVRLESLVAFLKANHYGLVWVIRGEKNVLGAGMGPKTWAGRLEISGAARIKQDRIEVAMNPKFVKS
jgi:hypothetical protein